MITEAQLKTYLKLPPDNAESLGLFISAAEAKAKAAGIPQFNNNKQYDLFILSLAAFYYENRSMERDEEAQKMIDSFVLELRWAEDGGTND